MDVANLLPLTCLTDFVWFFSILNIHTNPTLMAEAGLRIETSPQGSL